ncbi:hypothetical protein KC19_3G033500 [Ceratodon purpureus]|uniref:Uncharacterized protein n=1 Tax=Ceratodon purpureus TaxID=3225 RepID=A0A8T0IFE1_CERPU|nr:hypothetical protein KC19_3G033500 [Ceratodon purpureus]
MPFSFSSKHINFHSIDMPKKWTRTPLIKPSHLHHLSNKSNDYYHSKKKETLRSFLLNDLPGSRNTKNIKIKNLYQLVQLPPTPLKAQFHHNSGTKSKEKLPIPHHRSKKLMQNPAFLQLQRRLCASNSLQGGPITHRN